MQIHYFQRYHCKENVDTANTMLMLSRLYQYHADRFFAMLNDLILGADKSPEICFDLQVIGKNSVPDAVISQKSFKIVIETKLYNQFEVVQLINHLSEFGTEEIKVLLTLDPKPMEESVKAAFEKKLCAYNTEKSDAPVKHVNLTFEQLIRAMEDIVDERDAEMIAILDDFKQYCFDEKLISNGYQWMRAVTAGVTFADNIELGLYYDKKDTKYSEHGYIGLYKEKSIRAVGQLKKIVVAEVVNGELEYSVEKGSGLTADEVERIREAIYRAETYGYHLRTILHRYFLVDRFYPIDFRKSSKNPIQKSKLFHLAEMFGYDKMPDISVIAKDLDGRTWEEF